MNVLLFKNVELQWWRVSDSRNHTLLPYLWLNPLAVWCLISGWRVGADETVKIVGGVMDGDGSKWWLSSGE